MIGDNRLSTTQLVSYFLPAAMNIRLLSYFSKEIDFTLLALNANFMLFFHFLSNFVN